jgi:hypothetical protein
MFGELPKILDRNFVLAFLLPAALFVIQFLAFLSELGSSVSPFNSFDNFKADELTATTLFGLGAFLVALILLALNYEIYQFFEGYPVNSFSELKWLQRRRYNRLAGIKSSLDAEMLQLIKSGTEPPYELQERSAAVQRLLAERWPHDERYLLPTAFGNTIKAFEIYPSVMYGADAIPVWTRLQAVIPKDYSSNQRG